MKGNEKIKFPVELKLNKDKEGYWLELKDDGTEKQGMIYLGNLNGVTIVKELVDKSILEKQPSRQDVYDAMKLGPIKT